MIFIAKWIMRLAALVITALVLFAVHVLAPGYNLIEAGFVFFVLWITFSFAVTLLGGSWMVGKASSGGMKFGGKGAPGEGEQMQCSSYPAKCIVPTCETLSAPRSVYCVAHRLKCSPREVGK
jgi:hypothetical protein